MKKRGLRSSWTLRRDTRGTHAYDEGPSGGYREQQLGIDARFGRAAVEHDRRRAKAVAATLPDRLPD